MSEQEFSKDEEANKKQEEQANAETPEENNIAHEQPEAENTEESVVEEQQIIPQEETADEDEEEISSSDDEEKDELEEEDHLSTADYHSMTQEQLVIALKNLLQNKKIQDIKKEVQEIKSEFDTQFDEELNEKKEEFLAQGGNIIDFFYSSSVKSEFYSLYFDYKEKRNNHYKNLKKDLQTNLEKRLELIEELKSLLGVEENINTTFKHFKDIQERWRDAGPIPRDGYNTVWNTYHHHVENFYDFLHLNREFRDLDFKHNLEQKLKIISRAEELAKEENINKAFRELQMLHKMWKEETGPVAKEHRDEVWERFSTATKVIHDRRAENQKEFEKEFENNLQLKNAVTTQIKELIENTQNSHKAWQQNIKTLEELRETFFKIGKVPHKDTENSWSDFKKVVRNFNRKKNEFYKNQKQEQYDNLTKKKELIRIADENKDSTDFETATPLMKKVQDDWKQIGHVPRKYSDKIWKQFKEACNHYFNRLHAERNQANQEENEAFEKKSALLDSLKSVELSGDHKTDLDKIKTVIAEWKAIGRVPFSKKNIESKFNKTVDGLFKNLDLSKKEMELIRYDNKLSGITSQDDEKKIKNEHFFISKKIEELKNDIRQLENNLGFFQHVDENNPMVKEVHKNIKKHKDELELWKAKMKKLKEVL